MSRQCKKFAPFLSQLVDDTLPLDRKEVVLSHVASCDACRTEVSELRQLRSYLQQFRSEPDTARLDEKLLAIADDADEKLWLRPGTDDTLPSSWETRKRAGGAALVAMSSVAVLVVFMSLLLAPDFPRLPNPAKSVKNEFVSAVEELVEEPEVASDQAAAIGYASVKPEPVMPQSTIRWKPVKQLADRDDWCKGFSHCPHSLAGMPLVAYSSSRRPAGATMKLIYAQDDGVVAVYRVPGFLSPDGVLRTEITIDSSPKITAWQSGDAVIIVATNASAQVLHAVVSELPHEEPSQPGWWHSFNCGFSRMVGQWPR